MRRITSWVKQQPSSSSSRENDAVNAPKTLEGYVLKRGKYVNTAWKKRYLTFSNESMIVSYYDNKSSYDSGKSPKGTFVLSSLVALDNIPDHSFGFRAMGNNVIDHKPFELVACAFNANDQIKWISTTSRALKHTKTSSTTITSPSNNIKNALADLTTALASGNSTCAELSNQSEILKKAETDLKESHHALDRGRQVLNKMHRPMLHVFQRATTPQREKESTLSSAVSPTEVPVSNNNNTTEIIDDIDISNLSVAIDELAAQASVIGIATKDSREQMNRIEDSAARATNRVSIQTSRAKALMK